MDRASKAVPNRTIDISEWDPDEGSKCLTEFISSRKKIDVFYKLHASLFEKPIYNVLKMITRAKYFPEKMRTSRATFIPGPRTIFSLEALAPYVSGTNVLFMTDSQSTQKILKRGSMKRACHDLAYSTLDFLCNS